MERVDRQPYGSPSRVEFMRRVAPSHPPPRHLGPAGTALFDLFLANRVEGEDYTRCFARLGAHGYVDMLRRAFEQAGALPSSGSVAAAPLGITSV